MKILIADAVSEAAVQTFRKEKELSVEIQTGLTEDALTARIGDYDALVVRSATKVTARVLQAAKKMRVIGRAGSGVDNIDVPAATRLGIVVMNTPGANTVSTAEHSFAMLMALCRNIPQAYASCKEKKWERKTFQGVELRGKTLGIIGLGNIGKVLGIRARGFDMRVMAFDPFLSEDAAGKSQIPLVSFSELIAQADFISVHTPLSDETRHLLGQEAFSRCKKGVRIVNCARGGIVDENALVEAIDKGIVAGAALDVFEKEPPDFSHPLFSNPKVIFTPHLGASTEEAQEMVAVLVAQQIADALQGRGIRQAVNLPAMDANEMEGIRSFLRLGETLGGMHSHIAEGQMRELSVEYQGDFQSLHTHSITTAILKGFLEKTAASGIVNEVNARALAAERGLKLTESFSDSAGNYLNQISVVSTTSSGQRRVAGTVFGKNDIRILSVDGFPLNAIAQGPGIIYTNDDRPGMIAAVSGLLAEHRINIASMFLAREKKGGKAMVLINLDTAMDPEVLKRLRAMDGIHEVRAVEF